MLAVSWGPSLPVLASLCLSVNAIWRISRKSPSFLKVGKGDKKRLASLAVDVLIVCLLWDASWCVLLDCHLSEATP